MKKNDSLDSHTKSMDSLKKFMLVHRFIAEARRINLWMERLID